MGENPERTQAQNPASQTFSVLVSYSSFGLHAEFATRVSPTPTDRRQGKK